MKHKIIKIGHRGAMGYEPENTLRSFKKALELKVDMIELDVYTLKSGETIVIHDDKVDRTTNGQGYVMDKNFEDIRILDAGKGEKIPTLQEVLDLVSRKVKVNIELKGEKTAVPVTKIINKYIEEKKWKNDDFLVSSFNHVELKEFKKLCPGIKVGALIMAIPEDYASFGEKISAYSINLNYEFINQKFVDDAHKRKLKVFVWTVNDKDDIKKMKALKVDGIFTNFPDRI
jgi:glycerophosphoryl diester phosphodiesterase